MISTFLQSNIPDFAGSFTFHTVPVIVFLTVITILYFVIRTKAKAKRRSLENEQILFIIILL